MAVWEYKAILFEFSKDGLLSDRYVDEEEMERHLNQLGRQGWELVNVSLLQDGLLALMKRPDPDAPMPAEQARQAEPQRRRPEAARPAPAVAPAGGRSPRTPISVEYLRERVRTPDAAEDTPRRERGDREAPGDNDRIGGIRIS